MNATHWRAGDLEDLANNREQRLRTTDMGHGVGQIRIRTERSWPHPSGVAIGWCRWSDAKQAWSCQRDRDRPHWRSTFKAGEALVLKLANVERTR